MAWSVRIQPGVYIPTPAHFCALYSCARARTVASEVFTEAQSFADCKLHIRTRLLASAFSNFWKTPHPGDDLFGRRDPSRVDRLQSNPNEYILVFAIICLRESLVVLFSVVPW